MDKPKKILIVDDEPIGRQLLEAILYPEGYEIIFAENGETALELIFSELPDLVLLDVMMPKMDGFEVCKRVRDHAESAHIPIFLITALDDRDSKIRGIDSGADDYISKPFDRLEILAKIKNRTILVQYRQNQIISEGLKSDLDIGNTFNEQLFYNLTNIILENVFPINTGKIEIYPSFINANSRHSLNIIETDKGTFYSLFTTKHKGTNSVILKCIYAVLFRKLCAKKGISPDQLLEEILESLIAIKAGIDISEVKDYPDSIVIIYRENEAHRFLVSGLNQRIYFESELSPHLEGQNKLTFKPQILSNQNCEIRDSENIFIFSPIICEMIAEQKLIAFLDKHFVSSLKIDFQRIMEKKFSTIDDPFVIKLSI